MWTVIEANVGIICACLPALSKPLAVLFPRLKWFFAGQPSSRNTSNFTSTNKGYSSNAYSIGNYNSSNETGNSKNWVQLDSNGGTKKRAGTGVSRDSDEESLSPYGKAHGKEEGEVGMGGIVKTMEFSLQHDRDDGNSGSSADRPSRTPGTGGHEGPMVLRGDQQV
ncbi:MAG: hypothetical protein M1835_002358 [Candelina submexicana]|nr:MAG: hypothetical protein M1835_002358 [Candelina submexicana]